MERYTVDKAITLQAGVIALSDAQAAKRQHCLKRLMGKGRYEIQKPVQFKRGEVIGLEDINIKQYAGWLIPVKPEGGKQEAGSGKQEAGSGKQE